MRVRVRLTVDGREIDETLEGSSSEALLIEVKSKVQRSMGWKGLAVAGMTPIAFARTAVKIYNERNNSGYSLPDSAEEFIKLGVDLGFVLVLADKK